MKEIKNKLSFESSLKQLEEIVEKLESGDVDFMNGGGEWEIWTTHNEVLEN